MGLPLEERSAPLGSFGAGSLAGSPQTLGYAPEFWPFRNQMLITLAAMAFSRCDPLEILIGTVASDAVHPDGTTNFVQAMSAVLGAQGRVSVRSPAIELTGEELLVRSGLPAELLGWTFSCHTGEWACGQCRGCTKHNSLKARRQE
ncbi:7-cyano-7-deazaguanine synthase [Rhizorhabdus wittichii]|uniref:7-cyano-7-deazaguanine synthase n=1 Tax=Rhizorhabdus wittichii TaxID=160791 RepID=UPI0009DB4218